MKDFNCLNLKAAKLGVAATNSWKVGEINSSSVHDVWRTLLWSRCCYWKKLSTSVVLQIPELIVSSREQEFVWAIRALRYMADLSRNLNSEVSCPLFFFKFQLASYHNCNIISMRQFTCKCHSRRHWRMWICSQKLMSHFFSSLRLCSCSNSVAKSVSSGCWFFFFPCRNDFFSLNYFCITNLNSMMSIDEFEACFSDMQYIQLLFFFYKRCY